MAWPVESDGLSIVIPTYNERENIEELLTEISSMRDLMRRPLELVIVDDQSPDRTADLAREIADRLGLDLHILHRTGWRSLGGAIASGLRECRWDLACVMDADLSHPPQVVPRMLEALHGADGVVASRYVAGARIETWPAARRLTSLVATRIARSALHLSCQDPLSGFFLFRRSFLGDTEITGRGHKPLLEILVSSKPTVREVPYSFRNRANGESKLSLRMVVQYLSLVITLRSVARRARMTRTSKTSWRRQPREQGLARERP